MKIKKEDFLTVKMNVFMLLITLVTSNMVSISTFNILDYTMIGSVFIFPLVFYFGNKILKYVDKKTFFNIIVGIVFVQLIIFFILNKEITSINYASVTAFFLTQMINMFLFDKDIKKEIDGFAKKFFTYALVVIIDALLFNIFTGVDLGMGLLYAIIIKLIISLILSVIEYNDFSE